MLKKIIVLSVILSVSLTLSARGHRGGRPVMHNPHGAVSRPQPNYRPAPPPNINRPPLPPPRPKPDKPPRPPRPPHPPHPGHRPPPRPPYWNGYYYSNCVPVVPVVYYGDVPSDYTYAWYCDKYVICWRGWFWYNNAWVWGGQGNPPAPPNWRPR